MQLQLFGQPKPPLSISGGSPAAAATPVVSTAAEVKQPFFFGAPAFVPAAVVKQEPAEEEESEEVSVFDLFCDCLNHFLLFLLWECLFSAGGVRAGRSVRSGDSAA